MKIIKIALIFIIITLIAAVISVFIPGFDELFILYVNIFLKIIVAALLVLAVITICKMFGK